MSNLVITVHGIRTFGQWQVRLARLIRDADPATRIENYRYGYFSVLAFLLPPFRWLATKRFRKALRSIVSRNPGARISIVAHSFGTHIVAWGLRGLRLGERPKVHTILLAGSVLKSDFPWSDLQDDDTLYRVVNDCGTHDNILLLSQFLVLLTGMAGRLGFSGMTSDRFLNRYFVGGHSLYFEKAGVPSDDFMKKYWVPIFVSDATVEYVDERIVKGAIQGAVITLVQIADPIKLLFYFCIPLWLGYEFHLKPVNVAEARAKAEADAYTQIADLADRQADRTRRLWADHTRVIQALPTAKKIAALSDSLWVLEDALVFDFNKSSLPTESRQTLDRFVEALRGIEFNTFIIVTGYTGHFCIGSEEGTLAPDLTPVLNCTGGSAAYQLKLSVRLADSVKAYLVSKGVPSSQLYIEGKGRREGGLPYPKGGYAKQWNLIAKRNNRVKIEIGGPVR